MLVDADDANSAESLVLIAGGVFAMGDHLSEESWRRRTNELPVDDVHVDSFMMSRYQVTNQQYCQFLNYAMSQREIEVRDNVVYAPGRSDPYLDTYDASSYSSILWNGSVFTVLDRSDHPVVQVSWYGAAAYCNWMSEQQGYQACYSPKPEHLELRPGKQGYRLPTEAEWEYAARGGLQGARYPWGNTIVASQANYWNSGDPYDTGAYPRTTPVGFYDGSLRQKSQFGWPGGATSYQTTSGANGHGLHDMAGNVWEWCNDWYGSDYYGTSPYNNPDGPSSGGFRVLRGGYWNDDAKDGTVTTRIDYAPSIRSSSFGFRLVLDFQ